MPPSAELSQTRSSSKPFPKISASVARQRGVKRVMQERCLYVPVGRALEHTGLNQRGVQSEHWKAEGSRKLIQILEHVKYGKASISQTKEQTEI